MSKELKELGITPVLVPVRGSKDVTDMRIAWDAAILATDPSIIGAEVQNLSAIAVASHDADYLDIIRQLQALRELRRWTPRGYFVKSDISQFHTTFFAESVSECGGSFIQYHVPKRNATVTVILDGLTSRITFEPTSVGTILLGTFEETAVQLTALGYISGPDANRSGYLPIIAMAKFFYVNSLGPLVLFPMRSTLVQAVNAFVLEPSRPWIPDPGDLVYIHPVRSVGSKARFGSTQATEFADGGGLFLLRRSRRIVQDVLERLGYTAMQGDKATDAAISSFWERNQKYLRSAGIQVFEMEGTQCKDREQILYRAFTGQLGRQTWRTNIGQHEQPDSISSNNNNKPGRPGRRDRRQS
ncbi:unnamed protein product [Polarella glacialis]|uniref:Uncharacterized protein n=1 Tax=Polarella glacialis TaxID=89957 RepID=A0A813DY56_POLGL|nr:unnamed protein product [Polarella glacialis]